MTIRREFCLELRLSSWKISLFGSIMDGVGVWIRGLKEWVGDRVWGLFGDVQLNEGMDCEWDGG